VIYGEPRASVAFYELNQAKLKEVGKLTERGCNGIFWSPRGNMVILAALGANASGVLEFYDCDAGETVAFVEHFMCVDVEWDPSGRYVLTAVTQPLRTDTFYRYNTENGYKLWNMHGGILANIRLESCYQVIWRPRPPYLLSNEKQQEIKKNVKQKYYETFQKEDQELETSNTEDQTKMRESINNVWKQWRMEALESYEEQTQERIKARGGFASDDEGELTEVEEVQEEEVEYDEEVMEE